MWVVVLTEKNMPNFIIQYICLAVYFFLDSVYPFWVYSEVPNVLKYLANPVCELVQPPGSIQYPLFQWENILKDFNFLYYFWFITENTSGYKSKMGRK